MTQIERVDSFPPSPKSILDRLPLIAAKREKRRIERGEDSLSLLVIAKLMRALTTNGFTVTYVMNRKLYAGSSLGEMRYITDTSSTTQEQRVRLKGKDDRSFRVKLVPNQGKEGSNVSMNLLELVVKDHVDSTGPQRLVAFYKSHFKPSFWRKEDEQYAGRHFYGISFKNGRFNGTFDLDDDIYPIFLREILDSSVDRQATQEDYDRFELERKAQSTPRSKVMTGVIWNRQPNGLLPQELH